MAKSQTSRDSSVAGRQASSAQVAPRDLKAREDLRDLGVHSALDDYRNMKSALVHERIHKERGEGFENPDANPAFESYRHAKVYLAQMQDPTFVDAQFKSGMIGSVVNYLNKAVGEMREDYDPATEMSGLIADFNKLSDVTGYTLHMTVTGAGNNPDSYTYKVSATPVTPAKTKKQ